MGLLLLEVLLLELLDRRHSRRARKLEHDRGRAWAEGVRAGGPITLDMTVQSNDVRGEFTFSTELP